MINDINHDNKTLFEQYKLYVQMADSMSQRRQYANQYYTSLTVALISIPSTLDIGVLTEPNLLSIIIAIIGCMLCLIWSGNIQSYKSLSNSKFQVIYKLEAHLSFSCFKEEWELLKKQNHHVDLSTFEKSIPYSVFLLYFLFLIHSLLQFYFSPSII